MFGAALMCQRVLHSACLFGSLDANVVTALFGVNSAIGLCCTCYGKCTTKWASNFLNLMQGCLSTFVM